MLSADCLVDIFAFVDRVRLETRMRAVSKRFGAVLDAFFATAPPYRVLDALDVNLRARKFRANATDLYDDVIRLASDEFFRRAALGEDVGEFALPGDAPLPPYLRVLTARFDISGPVDFVSRAGLPAMLRKIVAAFNAAWADYAPAHVIVEFEREDKAALCALMDVLSVPALTLAIRGVSARDARDASFFQFRAVRDCARLEIVYLLADGVGGGADAIGALPCGAIAAWLHAAPPSTRRASWSKPRSYLQRLRDGNFLPPAREWWDVAQMARRELRVRYHRGTFRDEVIRSTEANFANLLNTFESDTTPREYSCKLELPTVGRDVWTPAPLRRANHRTREQLSVEWHELGENLRYGTTPEIGKRLYTLYIERAPLALA